MYSSRPKSTKQIMTLSALTLALKYKVLSVLDFQHKTHKIQICRALGVYKSLIIINKYIVVQ